MREALQASGRQQAQGVGRPVFVPAPIGGLNTRDSLAEMDPTDAPVLDNLFPRPTEVWERGGSLNWATGMTGSVQTIAGFKPTNGTNQLLAATNAGWYNITAGGAVGAVVQALTNGYVQSLMMTNSAGNSFLWWCNGTDPAGFYNGTTWTAATITDASGQLGSTSNISNCWTYAHRIFFLQKNSMNLYYLPVDSIQGAASIIPLGNLFRAGGYLIAGAQWTRNTYYGQADYMLLATSEGQVAVYQGTDPSSASSWGLVGIFFVGRPMGARCFFQYGGSVGIITESGIFPLDQLIIQMQQSQTTSSAEGNLINFGVALSRKIQPTWVALTQLVGVKQLGFEACLYPPFDALIINTQTLSGFMQQQFVMNTLTGAWCTFSNWPAVSFCNLEGVLYFGTAAGNAVQAWDAAQTLTNDNGSNIVMTFETAYNEFGSDYHKSVDLFQMLMAYNGQPNFSWTISPDFATVNYTSTFIGGGSGPGAAWETSSWDVSFWNPPVIRYKLWKSAAHIPGVKLSLWMQIQNNYGTLTWAGTNYIVRPAAMM